MKTRLKKNQWGVGVYFILTLCLHWNAILKVEDPIADTQTEGILYDQKMEQEKDGVKAAASPKVIFYGGQGFLTKGSLAKYDQDNKVAGSKNKKDSFNWSDWWDDKSSNSKAASPEAADDSLINLESETQTELTAPSLTSEKPVQYSTPKISPPASKKDDLEPLEETQPFAESDQDSERLPEPPPAQEAEEKGDSWW